MSTEWGLHTISSLHIGHTSLELAEAAAALSALSKDTLEIMSCVSVVEAGLFEACEFNETELSEGDSRLTFRLCCGRGKGETAGDTFRPLPKTLPPPRDLPEVMTARGWWFGGSSCHFRCRRGALGVVKVKLR